MQSANRSPQSLEPRGLLVTALLIVIVWGIAQAYSFLVPLSIASLLAFMMAPLVRSLRRVHAPEWLAVTISAFLLVLPFPALIYLLVLQGQAFIRDFPEIISSLENELASFLAGPFARRFNLDTYLDPETLLSGLASSAGQGVQVVISGLGALLSAGSSLALVLLFAVLMLVTRDRLRRSAERILSRNDGIETKRILDDVSILIERFLIARFLIVLIITAVDMIILSAFGIKYAFLMASFLGLMTLIPAIGFILGLIPPLIVSFAMGNSGWTTTGMAGALFFMSIIEGNVLTPKMVGGRLNINALATFVGLLAGALLWGVWGMLLAIPILGILRITFSEVPRLQPWGELLASRDGGEPNGTPPPAPMVRRRGVRKGKDRDAA